MGCVGVLRCREHDQDRQSENAHEVLSEPRDGVKAQAARPPSQTMGATQLLPETPPAERAEDHGADTEQRERGGLGGFAGRRLDRYPKFFSCTG